MVKKTFKFKFKLYPVRYYVRCKCWGVVHITVTPPTTVCPTYCLTLQLKTKTQLYKLLCVIYCRASVLDLTITYRCVNVTSHFTITRHSWTQAASVLQKIDLPTTVLITPLSLSTAWGYAIVPEGTRAEESQRSREVGRERARGRTELVTVRGKIGGRCDKDGQKQRGQSSQRYWRQFPSL